MAAEDATPAYAGDAAWGRFLVLLIGLTMLLTQLYLAGELSVITAALVLILWRGYYWARWVLGIQCLLASALGAYLIIVDAADPVLIALTVFWFFAGVQVILSPSITVFIERARELRTPPAKERHEGRSPLCDEPEAPLP